jgi:putative endonuclease
MNKKNIGNFGEEVAERYLKNHGYNILERNWRAGHKEIDLIVYKKILIAVEVKTRSKNQPQAFIPMLKASQVERIRKAIRKYCLLNNFNYQTSRLDLIIISKTTNNTFIKHYLDI